MQIHGCFDEFMELLRKVEYDEANDTLVLVGDLVNKGPNSVAVVDYIMKHPRRHDDGVLCVLGNHELKLFEVYDDLQAGRPLQGQKSLQVKHVTPRHIDYKTVCVFH
jgi:predicted MPP superfamily phosphohydrolase